VDRNPVGFGALTVLLASTWPAPTVDDLNSAGCVVSPPNPALLCYILT
jgi:hypothetical protein